MADNSILNRLDGLKLKYEETGQKLTDPEVIADVKQFIQLTKEYKELEPIIETSERYRTAIANLAEAKDTLAITIPATILEGSRFTFAPRTSVKPYLLTNIIRQDVRAKMECVRIPAVFRLFSLS